MKPDDAAREFRRQALSDDVRAAIERWDGNFADDPGFEPGDEMVFTLACKLGCFIAAADDEHERRRLRQIVYDALARGLAMTPTMAERILLPPP